MTAQLHPLPGRQVAVQILLRLFDFDFEILDHVIYIHFALVGNLLCLYKLFLEFFQRLFAEIAPEAAPRPGPARTWWQRLLKFLGLQS